MKKNSGLKNEHRKVDLLVNSKVYNLEEERLVFYRAVTPDPLPAVKPRPKLSLFRSSSTGITFQQFNWCYLSAVQFPTMRNSCGADNLLLSFPLQRVIFSPEFFNTSVQRRIWWPQYGHSVATVWSQCGHSMATVWLQYDHSMATVWPQYGHSMPTVWPQYDQSMVTVWPQYGHSMARVWPQYDHSMVTIWSQYGHSMALSYNGELKNAVCTQVIRPAVCSNSTADFSHSSHHDTNTRKERRELQLRRLIRRTNTHDKLC